MARSVSNTNAPLTMSEIRKAAQQLQPRATEQSFLDTVKSSIGLVAAHVRVAPSDIRAAYAVHLDRLRS